MSWKLVTELSDADHALRDRAVEGFVPEKVFDIHTHLFHTRHFAEGKRPAFLDENRGYGLRDFNEAVARWMPGRQVEGLFFGYPSAGNDRAGENTWMQDQIAPVVQNSNTRALVLAAPEDDPAAVRRLLESGVFIGIKCYRLYAPVEDTRHATIESFTPEWMWQLCHEFDGVLMLHIMRDGGITDPHNVETLRRLCRRYPRCRLVLAHVARSFNYRHAREGLQNIVDLDNVVVDTSAVTQAGAFRAALEVLGPRRVLWGSDYMVSELRGICFTQGDGFTWVYADDTSARDLTVFGHHTLVSIESLLCLREACEDAGMTPADIQDIFRDNALRLLAPHLRPSSVPDSSDGPTRWREAREKISCGTGLMSKRAESFDPVSWPSYFSRCSGPHIWDMNGRRFVDFTGGVGAILLGHSDPEVNAAVHRRVNLGSYCTLVAPEEVELAELLLELHPWAQRVRYARGGGEALALAVRIARAATGRSGVAFCGYHGWSDWYLAANLGNHAALDGHLLPGLEPHGVPRELAGTSVPFKYNDLEAFESAMVQLDGRLAAVVMEPFRSELPRDGFVEKVAARCRAAGAVLIVDEVTAGWRFGFPGGCAKLGIEPDIAVYAKAMSNGIPCGAVVGRGSVMDAANTSFISSSYWTDGIGPAAALACIRKMRRAGTQAYVEKLGDQLHAMLRGLRSKHPALNLTLGNRPCAPSVTFALGSESLAAKALMIRKMLTRGFMMSSQLYVMQAHEESHLHSMITALDETLTEIGELQAAGRLGSEAGHAMPSSGFTRLA
ncbi:glutamate-1-semialdehyde 2,1-aminomutase [Roseimicrobium gellanilyticum]|uniref:Glutamate-1-semialdehyde 2,1-aminomutase n=1 Tax=Roseimicrobium gellanilyticum TaxID=748857 RepID=A0A366HB49_9BACT|nr:aminotransferase class III-fold pyridoxal phosphate-dependent enzyme [Roseimicrobium gellanilyticum]RBP39129.1 glutamate-1-semialdehyde 2,1-aminomutase [Roseimicrobium gellanilyticum]